MNTVEKIKVEAALRLNWRLAIVGVCLMTFVVSANGQDVWITSHYDVVRQQPIASVVYQTPLPGPFRANGFVETWRNPENGYPASEWSVFSKSWVTYPITSRLSGSVGLEVVFNRPGVNTQWPMKTEFTPGPPRRVYAMPKVGLSYKVW